MNENTKDNSFEESIKEDTKTYEIKNKVGSNEIEKNIDTLTEDTSHINFTLAVLEEAAEAHIDVLQSVKEFQLLVKEEKLKNSDSSFQIECDDIRHLIATSKQMTLSLRLAADEASSAIGRETALEASKNFESELQGIKKAFELTAKHYKTKMMKKDMNILLHGGESAVNLVNSKKNDKTAVEKQLESKEATNSLKRVTTMIMESIYSIEAANELLDQDENNINRTGEDLDEYNNEAGTANKTLARIKAKEQRARYELYAAFAFFIFVVLYILVRRLPFLAFFLRFFGSTRDSLDPVTYNGVGTMETSKLTGILNNNQKNNHINNPSENVASPSVSTIESNFEKVNEENNKYFLKKEAELLAMETLRQNKKAEDVESTAISNQVSGQKRLCCMAMTASCLACNADKSIEDFCSIHQNIPGCPGEKDISVEDMMVEVEVGSLISNRAIEKGRLPTVENTNEDDS